jgi:hypothetical protein
MWESLYKKVTAQRRHVRRVRSTGSDTRIQPLSCRRAKRALRVKYARKTNQSTLVPAVAVSPTSEQFRLNSRRIKADLLDS